MRVERVWGGRSRTQGPRPPHRAQTSSGNREPRAAWLSPRFAKTFNMLKTRRGAQAEPGGPEARRTREPPSETSRWVRRACPLPLRTGGAPAVKWPLDVTALTSGGAGGRGPGGQARVCPTPSPAFSPLRGANSPSSRPWEPGEGSHGVPQAVIGARGLGEVPRGLRPLSGQLEYRPSPAPRATELLSRRLLRNFS